jgi:hypothetical protein
MSAGKAHARLGLGGNLLRTARLRSQPTDVFYAAELGVDLLQKRRFDGSLLK